MTAPTTSTATPAKIELPPIIPPGVQTETTHAASPMPTYAAKFNVYYEGFADVLAALTPLAHIDGYEGDSADKWTENVALFTSPLSKMAELSHELAAICGGEQAEYDRAFIAATPMAPVTDQQKVRLVQDDHSGANAGAVEKWLQARARHEADTEITAGKLGALDLPVVEGGDGSSDPSKDDPMDGDGGGFDDGTDGEGKGHGGAGSDGDKPEETPPVAETPDPTAPVTPSATPTTPTTPLVGDRTPSATTTLSGDGNVPITGASALSPSSNATPSMPTMPPSAFTASNAVGANPNLPWNPARQAAADKKKAEDEQTARAAAAVTPVVGIAGAGIIAASDAQPQGPPTHTSNAAATPTPAPSVAEQQAAKQQQMHQAVQQSQATGGLGSGAKIGGSASVPTPKKSEVPPTPEDPKPKPADKEPKA